ncbi:rab11 family-interacting protein 4A-like isoform X2 [Amphiura filiformis]|uniref:rab11 family-interacting protein 4A-like isoform X2 n=1 Tax=Amphiura filiformis TaxID=82378 RepID=UPI003B214A15
MSRTSESTYNEYDDSAFADMSEDNTSPSPLFYDGHLPALDGDDADSAIAGTTGLNGFYGDHIKSHNGQHGSSTTASSLISEGEERFEDFGENNEAGSGIEIEVQQVPTSLSGSSETLLDRHTPTNAINNNPVRRITSKEFANQLYRSSSSNSLPRGTTMEDAYGEYAASDSDVVELNDKVKELEDQVTVLEQDNASRLDNQSKLKHDNALLHQQINSLEEQLREAELRHQEVSTKESRRHRELLIRQERDYQDQIESLSSKLAVLENEKERNDVDIPRLKTQLDHFKKEKSRLESELQDIDQKWLALSMEYQRKQEQFTIERQELEEMLKANEALIDELSKEVRELRHYQAEQEHSVRLMRSPSISDLPSRFDEVKKEVHKLKRENAHLKESNEEMSAQMLNNSVQIGRSLLHRGTQDSKSESFAAELETSSKDDIMQALKEEERMNHDLREYIGQILTRVLESNPGLLEIKPRQRHGSTASAASTSSSCT